MHVTASASGKSLILFLGIPIEGPCCVSRGSHDRSPFCIASFPEIHLRNGPEAPYCALQPSVSVSLFICYNGTR